MNSKAIRKQLLAAVAMVLVAAVALGSSTYAWFVASGVVTAEGMKVQAQSEGGLVISYGGEAWGTSASANMTATKKLLPTSTNDLTEWVHASAKAANSFAAAASSYTDVSEDIFDTGEGTLETRFKEANNYAVMKKFLVRSSSKDTANLSKGLFVKDIKVTLSSSGAAVKTMSTAMRVGVQCGTNKYIFGPVTVTTDTGSTSATDGYQVYHGNGTADGTVTLATKGETSVLVASDTTISNDVAGVPVYIYIWFEGEDQNLFSDNYNVEDLSVSVDLQSFSSVPSTPVTPTTKVDLTSATVDTNTTATAGDQTYYKVSVQAEGKDLYTLDTSLSSTSKVYTIADGVATEYKNVTLPT